MFLRLAISNLGYSKIVTLPLGVSCCRPQGAHPWDAAVAKFSDGSKHEVANLTVQELKKMRQIFTKESYEKTDSHGNRLTLHSKLGTVMVHLRKDARSAWGTAAFPNFVLFARCLSFCASVSPGISFLGVCLLMPKKHKLVWSPCSYAWPSHSAHVAGSGFGACAWVSISFSRWTMSCVVRRLLYGGWPGRWLGAKLM